MSKITSPILLDSTGQDINATLQGIQYAMQSRNTLIDDTSTSATTVWSSKKITEALTTSATIEGSSVTIEPIAATPIDIITTVAEQSTLTITHKGNGKTVYYETVIPTAGTLNWTTGKFTLVDGSVASLEGFAMMAFPGTNTLSVNKGTMTVNYRVLATGTSSGGTCDCSWDVISGGSAAEEV